MPPARYSRGAPRLRLARPPPPAAGSAWTCPRRLGRLRPEAVDEGLGAGDKLLLVLVGLELRLLPACPLHHKGAVAACILLDLAAGKLQCPGGDAVEDGAVVAHNEQRAGVAA